jgi:hypothetical protein
MTPERLGVEPATAIPVWVWWCEHPLLDAVRDIAPHFVCPECGGTVDLTRARGVIACVSETPNCASVSDRCPHCQTRLHFDATPASLRRRLRWPNVAVGKSGYYEST